MATYCVIRDGQLKITLANASLDAAGKVTAPTTKGRGYIIDGELAKQDGVLDRVAALAKALRYTEIDPKYLAEPGTSPSGLRVITMQEWQAEQRAAYDRRQAALLEAVPGLNLLRAAIDDQARYHRQFAEMMEDENNDGANPPKRATADLASLRKQYPRAAAYLQAEAWQDASHYVKSGAGRRAKERIVAGEDCHIALADMAAEWTSYCEAHAFD